MSRMRTTVTASVLAVGLLAGCASMDTYPPALPVPEEQRSPSPVPVPSAPPEPVVREHPAMAMLPSVEEWALWTPYIPPVPPTCTGTGKRSAGAPTRHPPRWTPPIRRPW